MANEVYIELLERDKTTKQALIAEKQQTLLGAQQQIEQMNNNIVYFNQEIVKANDIIDTCTSDIQKTDEIIAILSA